MLRPPPWRSCLFSWLTDEQRDPAETIERSGNALLDIINIPDDGAAHLRGDSGRLRQVLLNLLGNAVKFIREGHVELRVEQLEDDGSTVLPGFDVEDAGIGMAVQRVEDLFDAFTQLDGARTRRFGGSGLGLAIATRLVALMGGEIRVDSTLRKGSIFRFGVRFVQQIGSGAAPTGLASLAKRRICVVDDHAIIRAPMSAMCSRRGVTCVCCASGDEALARLRAEEGRHGHAGETRVHGGYRRRRLGGSGAASRSSHDLIFMDCQMSGMDGYQATTELRAREVDGVRVPIIALRANAMKGDREKCPDAGMDDQIPKLLRLEVFESSLQGWRQGFGRG